MSAGTIAVRDLQPLDVLDLEGDEYATKSNMAELFEFEYAEVTDPIVWETSNCVVVHTTQGSFGMPPNHQIKRGVR